jgi:hypothetical protein
MNHQEAIDNQTAERYVLGELSEAECDAYEQHFFTCAVCAEEIKLATQFMDAARKVVQKDRKSALYSSMGRRSIVWGGRTNFRSFLRPGFAVAASALLAVGLTLIGYQNLVTIPQLKQQTMAKLDGEQQLRLTRTRGPAETAPKAQIGKLFPLELVIPPGNAQTYEVTIETDSGMKKSSFLFSSADAINPVHVSFVPGNGESGEYVAVIREVTSGATQAAIKGELERIPFKLMLQK